MKTGFTVECSCGGDATYMGIVNPSQVERYGLLKRFDREHGRACGGRIVATRYATNPAVALAAAEARGREQEARIAAARQEARRALATAALVRQEREREREREARQEREQASRSMADAMREAREALAKAVER